VNLCGHATLASAFVAFEKLGLRNDEISFHSRSGKLSVKRQQNRLTLNFPVQSIKQANTFHDQLAAALQTKIVDVLSGEDLIAVVESEEDVLSCQPNLALIAQLPFRGVIITAAGKQKDFVCRFFGPRTGVNEDPVTGSAYTELMPYWAEKLGKKQLNARQLSARGGNVECCLVDNNRVLISGYARLYLEGFLHLGEAYSSVRT
jgi:PhzF family phenazine biosynthesis protein